VLVVAAAATTILVTLFDQWVLGGFVIGTLILMLVIENVRRSWKFGGSVRLGIALGILVAWLIWRFA